jgi:Xaa-Pro aminopeptidase
VLSKRRDRQPSPQITDRLRACRNKITQKSLDGYLVTNRADQYYLTGFNGEDGAALILRRRVVLVTDGRFAEEAAKVAPWATAVVRTHSLPEALGRLARRHRLERIGFDAARVTVKLHAAVRRAVRPARLVAVAELVQGLRLIKDATEVAALTRAVRIAESAFKAVVGRLRLGTTERRLAAALQHEMICRGASEASFPIVVAEGVNSSLPHAVPGERRIRAGSAVLIDWGARFGHYCSDLTRVVFIHRIPPRFRRMYENVYAAQAEAIRAIHPGVRMCDVDRRARSRLQQAGLAQHFAHGLGHGIGLDVHEQPRLAKRVTEPLEAGMVVTVEPGVYLPGVGGVRIEDDVLVTQAGCRVLSRLPRDLDAMVI